MMDLFFFSYVKLNYCWLLQTILPLMACFGKGLCADGTDAIVRIGIYCYLKV